MKDPYREADAPALDGDPVAHAVLARHVEPGEKLSWAARPVQGMRLTSRDWFLVPFSLMWGGFAIFWELAAIIGGAPFFFWLWGLPFVAVGLYLIAGRFLVDSRRRARTFYGVTDRHAMILVEGRRRNLTSIDLLGQSAISLSEGSGRGTIRFGDAPASPQQQWWGASWPGQASNSAPTFDEIENARAVYDRVRVAQTVLRAPPVRTRVDGPTEEEHEDAHVSDAPPAAGSSHSQ